MSGVHNNETTSCMPVTNATSEQSFSALRRVKSYLRSSMSQTRLNNLMVLHVHKTLTDGLNLNEVGNEFLGNKERDYLENFNFLEPFLYLYCSCSYIHNASNNYSSYNNYT